jgi:hypothetical protein
MDKNTKLGKRLNQGEIDKLLKNAKELLKQADNKNKNGDK